jgi:hypothetical protein
MHKKTNRAHLTPTVITDKNGKSTTVHKKPAAEPISKTKLPNVTLPATGISRAQLEQEVAEALTKYDQYAGAELVNSYRKALQGYSDHTLHRINSVAPALDAGAFVTHLLLLERPDDAHLNDWVAIKSITLSESMDPQTFIRGLIQYENLTPQQDEHYPPRRTEEVLAISRVTAHFCARGDGNVYGRNDEYDNIEYIEDAKLRALLTAHENPAAVADIIIQRGITDVYQIMSLLDSMKTTATAIHRGTL